MMNPALRELGLDWRYLALPVDPAAFAETVAALPRSGYRGVNVTMPHKAAALALADAATDAAAAIGAANTLSFEEGHIEAENTDAGGLLDAIAQELGGCRALVLGAGGAGRAAAWALRQAGADVSVWNRTPERAAVLARELGVRHAPRVQDVDVLVNATSVGLGGTGAGGRDDAIEALGLSGLRPPPTVVDLAYGEPSTPVVEWATRGGARVVDGLEVLVAQGARSLSRWTGRQAPVETMREAVRNPAI